MTRVDIHMCPETGICSILKQDGGKIDMAMDEVDELREASGHLEKIRELIADLDSSFNEQLDDDDIAYLSRKIK